MGFARLSEADVRALCTLTHRQLRVMLALRLHGDKGLVWPGLGRLCDLTGIDRRNARRTLTELEALGLLARHSGGTGRNSTRYKLLQGGLKQPRAKTAPPGGATVALKGGATVAPLTDKEQGGGLHPAPTEQTKEAGLPPKGGAPTREKNTALDRLRSRLVASTQESDT